MYYSRPKNYELTINTGGKLLDMSVPRIMGILNVTPDSFYAGSRLPDADAVQRKAADMFEAGVDILDLGGYSSRPGALNVLADEEYSRLAMALERLRNVWPDAVISVDTFRADVARKCVENFGVDIINDIGGGTLDERMFQTVADLKVAYVLMHMRGTPMTMNNLTDYNDVTADVISNLAFKAAELRMAGVCDIIIDPGFGFAKTTEQNFKLLADLSEFKKMGYPLLAGLSRKSMIWKTLGITAEDSLPGTITLNTVALMNGADILRVHDVREASMTVKLLEQLKGNGSGNKISVIRRPLTINGEQI